jgi:hypothetical protein
MDDALYASEALILNDDEIWSLQDLANNLAFGIGNCKPRKDGSSSNRPC